MKNLIVLILFVVFLLSNNSVLATTYSCSDEQFMSFGFNPDKTQACLDAKKISKAAYQNCLEFQEIMSETYDYNMKLLKQGKCFEELEVKQAYASGNCSVYYINENGRKKYIGKSTYNLKTPDYDACVNSLLRKYSIIKE